MASSPTPPNVSLLIATVGRTAELTRLFESLSRQTYVDFEIVVVDQNSDDRLIPIIEQFASDLTIERVQSEIGLSHARNVGMAFLRGEIVAFPDDDCIYPEATLERVVQTLEADPDASGLTGRGVDFDGHDTRGRFDHQAGPISVNNVWRRATSATIFLRAAVLKDVGEFDEQLGLGAGTKWGCGEETDYLSRALERGHVLRYDPTLTITHPARDIRLSKAEVRRTISYARGHGYVVRAHAGRADAAMLFVRPVGGVLIDCVRCRFREAVLRTVMAVYRLVGWWDYSRLRRGQRDRVTGPRRETVGRSSAVSRDSVTSDIPRVSMIVATVDRPTQLTVLLESLTQQTYKDFEVVLVDQNQDDCLVPIIERFESTLAVHRVESSIGASHARNVGIPHLRGEIVAFPDDDCSYPPASLERIVQAFDADPSMGGLTCRCIDRDGHDATARFHRSGGAVSIANVWRRGVTSTIFLRAAVVKDVGSFDEQLGVGAGTKWGAGEETDYLCRVLERGHKVLYDPTLTINHPPRPAVLSQAEIRRAIGYGRGYGYVARTYAGRTRAALMCLRPFGGGVLDCVRCRFRSAILRWFIGAYRVRGWWDYSRVARGQVEGPGRSITRLD